MTAAAAMAVLPDAVRESQVTGLFVWYNVIDRKLPVCLHITSKCVERKSARTDSSAFLLSTCCICLPGRQMHPLLYLVFCLSGSKTQSQPQTPFLVILFFKHLSLMGHVACMMPDFPVGVRLGLPAILTLPCLTSYWHQLWYLRDS